MRILQYNFEDMRKRENMKKVTPIAELANRIRLTGYAWEQLNLAFCVIGELSTAGGVATQGYLQIRFPDCLRNELYS